MEKHRTAKNVFGLAVVGAIALGIYLAQPWVYGPAIAVLAFCPTSWDPAIRIKEAQIRAGHHPESGS